MQGLFPSTPVVIRRPIDMRIHELVPSAPDQPTTGTRRFSLSSEAGCTPLTNQRMKLDLPATNLPARTFEALNRDTDF